MDSYIQDNLKWQNDPEIVSIIGKEKIYYSNKITKVNSYGIAQERTIVLTNDGIYNVHSKKTKRKMKFNEISGITFSSISNEFVIHGNDAEYDYQYQSKDKKFIIFLIATFYQKIYNKNIKLCEVNEKNLRNYVASKTDKKKGNYSKMDENFLIDTQTFLFDNIPVKNTNGDSNNNDNIIRGSVKLLKDSIITSNVIFSRDEKLKTAKFGDFNLLKVIESDGVNKTILVTLKNNKKDYYTLKSFENKNLCKNYFEIINMIANLCYPFLINSIMSFQTKDRLYFVFPFIPGEKLYKYIYINRPPIKFNENQIKIYAAVLGLTLDYIHANCVEFTDINLKDILLGINGYPYVKLKIENLISISKEEKILNEYTAPEIYLGKKKEKISDWWSYGIIIYELFYGITPFFSEDKTKLKDLIINKDIKFPVNCNVSTYANDFLRKILNKKMEQRLGYNSGFDEIKKHSFFKEINFDDIINQKVDQSFKPAIEDIFKRRITFGQFTRGDLIQSNLVINID